MIDVRVRARTTPWTSRRASRRLLMVLGVLIASAVPALAKCPAGANPAHWVDGGAHCLTMAMAGMETAGSTPIMVVLLHGDVSSGGPADYLAHFAKSIVRKGVVVVTLIRPGYEHSAGRKSQGSHNGRRDHYTAANIDAVGQAIQSLKDRHKARRVIVMGHSGGAATVGVLVGRRAGLIDAAVLVSCPCNIATWRAERGRGPWRQSLSPHTYAAKVPKQTRVVAITGGDDDNTSPGLAQRYVRSLTARGLPARFVPVTGAGHRLNTALEAAAKSAIEALLGH